MPSQPTEPQPAPAVPPPPSPDPAAPAAPDPGFLGSLLGLYFEPTATFRALLPRPRTVAVVLALVAVNLVFTSVWMSKMDAAVFIRSQIEASGRADQIPADRMDEIVSTQAKVVRVFGFGGALLGAPLLVLAAAALFLFVYRLVFSTTITYGRSAAVVAWSFLPVSLVTTVLMLSIFALRGEWNTNPQEILPSNLGALFEAGAGAVPKALHSLASSLDVFSLWTMWLLSAGFGAAARKSAGWALPGVVVPWALFVLAKAGLAALF